MLITAIAAVVAVGGGTAWAVTARTAPSTAPSRSAPVDPDSVAPVAEPTTLSPSDSFDGWTVSGAGAGTTFLQTGDGHGRGSAVSVVRDAEEVTSDRPAIAQNITVPQDSSVLVSFWAASDAATAGAVQVGTGGVTPSSVALPAGPYDWSQFSFSWAVPAKTTTMTLSIVALGTTMGTRIDDIHVQGQGSHTPQVQDGGFETSSAVVALDERSLVLKRSDDLDMTSRLAPDGTVSWSMSEYSGGASIKGRARLTSGRATVPLAGIPTGYYALTLGVTVDGRAVRRSTDVVITTAVPAESGTAPMLGVGMHLGGGTEAQQAQQIADLASLGIRTARTDADWSSIEVRAGVYDFSVLDGIVAGLQRGGLRPLLIADYRNALYDGGRTPSSAIGIGAYARFAAAVAQRYPSADVEVYNEFDFRFNDGACGKTPGCYLQLLGPTSAALRASGGGGVIAGPAVAGSGVPHAWLQGFIAGDGLREVGALSIHPYVQPDRPDVLEPQLIALRASMTAAGGAATPIWFTEFGTATGSGGASERQQAEDAARVFAIGAAHGVSRIYWYDAIDDGTDRSDPEDNFGLFRSSTSLVPGALVPKPTAAIIATAARLAAATTPVPSDPDGGRIRRIDFGATHGVSLSWASSGETVAVALPGTITSMTGRALAPSRMTRVGSSPVWNTR